MPEAVEVNFDGLIGPTHHYGGLSHGNVASATHRYQKSSPKQAALQGLRKMKLLADRGVPQAVLPPHPRPYWPLLNAHGHSGNDANTLVEVARTDPALLSVAMSASSMWAANAATVSPSLETADGRVHLTPANLWTTTHRRLEPEFTWNVLRKIFPCPQKFCVHSPLPARDEYADEGAANHSRLCRSHAEPGIELFVYGRSENSACPQMFPARQSRAACERIIQQHRLAADRVVLAQQSPAAIDAGVFHNDVIAVAHQQLLLCHQQAWVDQNRVLAELREKFPDLQLIEITDAEMSLTEAVQTYLFNSQLVSLEDQSLLWLFPIECQHHPAAQRVIGRLKSELELADSQIEYVDVRQSMQNGGGPACLRLRVVLTREELGAIHQPILLTDDLYERLVAGVEQNYRDELDLPSLAEPDFLEELSKIDELIRSILQL